MLDTAFSTLKDFFSRSFIVGRFFPAFVAVLLNALLIAMATKGVAESIEFAGDHLKIGELATAVGIAIMVATLLAFIISPLLPGFRLLLEGEMFPRRLRQALIEESRRRAEHLTQQVEDARSHAHLTVQLQADSDSRLAAAQKMAPATAPRDAELKKVEAATEALAREMKALQAAADSGTFASGTGQSAAEAIESVIAALEAAFATGSARLPKTAPKEERARSERLAKQHRRFVDQLLDARQIAGALLRELQGELAARMVADDPRPTRLGNLRARLEDYCRSAYDVEFDYLWPRLLMVLDAEDSKAESVEEAQSQFDFALMLLLLVALSSAAWLAVLIFEHARPGAIVAAGILAPLLTLFFYNVVLASQRALVETIKAAIDRFRLDVLDKLNAPKPENYDAEVKTWKSLQAISAGYFRGQPFKYKT